MVHLSYVKSDTANFLMGAFDNDKGRYRIRGPRPRDAGILITGPMRKRYQDLLSSRREYDWHYQCGACKISDGIFKYHTKVSNVTNISFMLICASQGISAPLYAIFYERWPLLDRHQTKRVGAGLDDIERDKLRILMLET
jgi:hypothetical protein